VPELDELAIDGGRPMIPAGPPPWPRPDDDVRDALAAAYSDGSWGRYHGPHCDRLCELLTQLVKVKHAWLCSSGTIAVELALRGLKVSAGDEVVLAAYDFPGNFRAIEALGARPVLVDLVAGSWTIDVEQMEAAISPRTKAVIASHLHASLADVRRLRQITDAHSIALVEDACQAPGAKIASRPAGSWGHCGVFSFGGSKLLTAGRGGAIVTNREDVVQRIRVYSERGNYAFPLSELQAAVLVPQIPKLAAANQQRLAAVQQLLPMLADVPGLAPLPLVADEQNQPAFFKLPWLLAGNDDACDSPEFEQLRRRFIEAVQAEGVMIDEGFRGFARRTSNRCRVVGDLANARRAAAGTVLMHHPVLLEPAETIAQVAAAIRKVARATLDRNGTGTEGNKGNKD
jgi:dTDP-4-amino-4,6-dideoxygalactose transaminase